MLTIIIIDLLITRRILPYNSFSEDILFVITIVINSIGSFILLSYAKRIIQESYSRSFFIKMIFISTVIISSFILGILWTMLFSDLLYCNYHFSLCDNRIYHSIVNVTSSMSATAILIAISFKFFSWYRTNYKNYLMLLFGLLAVGMIIALVGDNINELLLTKTIVENSSNMVTPKAYFPYSEDKKHGGQIQYQITNPEKTILFLKPSSDKSISQIISQLTSYPHNTFRWFSVVLLLYYYYYFKTERARFWVLTAVPLILFIIGSGFIFSLPSDSPYSFYLRVIYRAGNIGDSLLFGLIFYYVLKKIEVEKIKDYLTLVAMDIIMFDLAFSTSAYQPTYGIAAHSLVLLCACFVSIGWYSLALSIAQDKKLRQTIREKVKDESKLLDSIGTAQMEQEAQNKVMKIVREYEQRLKEQSGIPSSMQDNDIRTYMDQVLQEVRNQKEQK